jgi:hypothetical protein
MKKKLLKALPVQLTEIRDAVFNHDANIKIQLDDAEIWSVVHRDLINEGVIFLQVLGEFDDYYDVAIPGDILLGSRIVRTSKTGHLQWCYQIKP